MSFMSFEVTKDTNLKYGTKNDGVKKLQTLLNQNGYNLAVDGSFGSKTLDAVKDFQKNNGLSVDGIVGTNTWGKLNSSNKTTTTTTKNTTADLDTKRNQSKTQLEGLINQGYQDNDIVKQAEAMIQQQMANKPGEFNSEWMNYLNDTINKINNREPFTYDVNGDALYQQYKDQYKVLGNMAMMDTMGQAAAMNGGYGSSYAQSVGQQAYQGYLQQLTDKIPELYQLARDQYNQEGQDLYNQFGLYSDMYDKDLTQHRYKVDDWKDMLNYYTDDYRYKDTTAREEYRNNISDLTTLYNLDNDEYWNTLSWDRTVTQDEIANELAQREMAIKEGEYALSQLKTGYETGDLDLDGKIDEVIDDGDDGEPGDEGVGTKGWKDHDTTTLAKNQKAKGGSYYSDALADLKEFKKAGKTQKEALAYLEELVGESYISRSEYLTLANAWRDGKL